MLLLKAIKMNNNIIDREDEEYIKQYSERWKILNEYNCSPWNEIEWMKDVLLMSNPNHKEQYIVQGFDRGRVVHRFSFGETIKEEINISYSFLRMLENIGIPHRFGFTSMFSKSAINASKWISKYSESWALSTIIRCNAKEEDLEFVMSRDRLNLLSDDKIKDYFKIFTKALDNAIDNEPLKGYNYIFYMNQINSISEILSRIIVRLDDNQIDCVYNIVLKMYKSLRVQRDIRINKSLERIIDRLFKNMSNNQKLSKLDELLRLDIEMENQYKLNKQNYQVAIFNYIHLSGIDINNSDKLKQTLEDIIKENLDFLNNDDINIKDRALTRLRLLNKICILGEEEKELFGNILWKSSKQGELPESNLFLKSIYKELPIPKDIDINSIYLNYLKNEDITCSHNLKFRNYTNTCIEIIDNLYKMKRLII